MSVIILTPSYNGEEVLPEFLSAYEKQRPDDIVFYHLFCTNNCTDRTNEIIDDYTQLVMPRSRRISWNYPKDFIARMGTPYAALAIARQRLLLEAGKMMCRFPSKPTHVLLTDDDTFPVHDDAIETAVAWGMDILGGSYLRHFPEGTSLASKWLDALGRPFSVEEIFAPLSEPYVTSAGFMLLSRRVVMDILNRKLFWWPIFDDRQGSHPPSADDFGFCIGARKLKYTIFLDGTMMLKHLWRDRKRPWWSDGKQYQPFEFKEAVV